MLMKIISVITFATLVYAVPVPSDESKAITLVDNRIINADGSYAYQYQTSNNISANVTADPSNLVNGVYSYIDPSGALEKVVYTAGTFGFEPLEGVNPEIINAVKYEIAHPPTPLPQGRGHASGRSLASSQVRASPPAPASPPAHASASAPASLPAYASQLGGPAQASPPAHASASYFNSTSQVGALPLASPPAHASASAPAPTSLPAYASRLAGPAQASPPAQVSASAPVQVSPHLQAFVSAPPQGH